MSSDLDHLTKEERKTVLEIFPKEIKDLESSDDIKKGEQLVSADSDKQVEGDSKETKNKISKNVSEENWKDGYLDYEVKTKESDRVVFDDGDIEIVEEDL